MELTFRVSGNGWVAAVMHRVLGTIKNAQHSSSKVKEQGDVINWITEIHGGRYKNWVRDEGPIVHHNIYLRPRSLFVGFQLYYRELRRPPALGN